MPGYDDFLVWRLRLGGIAKENTRNISMLEFVNIVEMGVTKISEHPKLGVRWPFVKWSVIFKSG